MTKQIEGECDPCICVKARKCKEVGNMDLVFPGNLGMLSTLNPRTLLSENCVNWETFELKSSKTSAMYDNYKL